MKLSELIAQVGDENIEVQPLHESFIAANAIGSNASIRFAAGKDKVLDMACSDRKYLCLILWIPRERISQ
jgi:hypothetical protein